MNTHRYNRDEISKILKRAAELEHKDNIDDDSDGLTVEELQQVSREVGIHPKYIHLALDELKNPAQSFASSLWGGPFSYNLSDMTAGTLKDEQWEEVVSEIRRIHGGIGKTSKLGNTFEWEQRKKEVGYVQISLSPKKDHTNIRINANYRYFASMVYIMTGIFGFVAYAILLDETNLPLLTQIFASLLGIPALLAGARFYLSYWIGKKRKIYHKLFKRFREMLSPTGEKEDLSSITISENNQAETKEDRFHSGSQKSVRS
ncbi:MAG: hypothetical protein JXR26_09970 [Balneolaceae bacterium]|nr:hypothetical protein [Balneolaceae bacterium]